MKSFPIPNDQDNPERLLPAFGPKHRLREGDIRYGLVFGPFLQFVTDEDAIIGTPIQFSGGLEGSFSNVFFACC